ncbi:A/G-specific adenine glycosylase [Evansella caseinilytica]|uniref:Adenine DNA glycosylase n=1 Tax=Evansella caseinilytica TaxID=1503961 RepID=A0A1H3J2U7_9BACI|nr:A/G-specific adenine glycosylase [Evansella caseinilytica]SDY33925.1 A/G-specific adenine glycosylase [Evansella caseinilytica]
MEKLQRWDIQGFQEELLQWYCENKRDLPWRREKDPYKIWVSEIMLQQTKVDTVIPYYERFMNAFPTIEALANADEETVLKTWEGLGYYSRARNLHQAVKEVKENYGGAVPDNKEDIHNLRGVGPYTAGAILSIAFNIPAPAVDGNVMRVLSRLFLVYDDIMKGATRKIFEGIVEEIISEDAPSDFNQAIMELGALICTPRSPACLLCPVQRHCLAREEGVQEQLPVKKKKTAPQLKRMKAVVLVNHVGQVLIEQRQETGLLAKMWQFPNVEAGTEDHSDLTVELRNGGLLVNIEADIAQHVRHVFTHLIWEIDVYRGTITMVENEALFQQSRLKLVEPENVDWYPFPVSHQKIIDKLLKGAALT